MTRIKRNHISPTALRRQRAAADLQRLEAERQAILAQFPDLRPAPYGRSVGAQRARAHGRTPVFMRPRTFMVN